MNQIHAVERLLSLRIAGDDDRVMEFPRWAKYLVSLGALVGAAGDSSRLTVAVSLPTRNFGVLLVGLGAVLSKSSMQIDHTDRFEMLTSLPSGTPVKMTRKGRILKGVIDRVGQVRNKSLLFVVVSNKKGGRLSYSIDPSAAHTVEPIVDDSAIEVKLPTNQKGREILDAGSPLVAELLGKNQSQAFELQSRTDAAFVGRRSRLQTEADLLRVMLPQGSIFPISDCLRLTSEARSRTAYRTRLVSPRSTDDLDLSASVVVFDGAAAYLAKGAALRSSHRVIVLDRAEVAFQQAALVFNQEYLKRAGNILFRERPLQGIEVSGYIE